MDKKHMHVAVFLALALLVGCGPTEPPRTEMAQAEPSMAADALKAYFRELASGEYEEAASYYGGSYQILRDQNPQVDPDDHRLLFQQACESNGYICLPVGEVVDIQEISPEEFAFSVEFIMPGGEVFVRGPCCGASEEDMPRQSSFEFRVARDETGQYRVMDLPVYVP